MHILLERIVDFRIKKKRRRRKKAKKILCNDDANRSIDKVLVGINHRSLLTGSNRFYLFLPLPRSKFLPIDTNFLPPSICLRRGRDKRESKMERGHKYQSEKWGRVGKAGRYSPGNNSSLPFRHIIPRRGIVRSVPRYATSIRVPRREYRYKGTRGTKGTWLDRNARQAWAEGVCILCLRSKLVEAGW